MASLPLAGGSRAAASSVNGRGSSPGSARGRIPVSSRAGGAASSLCVVASISPGGRRDPRSWKDGSLPGARIASSLSACSTSDGGRPCRRGRGTRRRSSGADSLPAGGRVGVLLSPLAVATRVRSSRTAFPPGCFILRQGIGRRSSAGHASAKGATPVRPAAGGRRGLVSRTDIAGRDEGADMGCSDDCKRDGRFLRMAQIRPSRMKPPSGRMAAPPPQFLEPPKRLQQALVHPAERDRGPLPAPRQVSTRPHVPREPMDPGPRDDDPALAIARAARLVGAGASTADGAFAGGGARRRPLSRRSGGRAGRAGSASRLRAARRTRCRRR